MRGQKIGRLYTKKKNKMKNDSVPALQMIALKALYDVPPFLCLCLLSLCFALILYRFLLFSVAQLYLSLIFQRPFITHKVRG